MAAIIRGNSDESVGSILDALNAYESEFPGSIATVYRQNPGSIRVRIIDDRFAGMSRSRRHNEVWDFLAKHVGEDSIAEVGVLILLPTTEVKSSLANMEFEDPVHSEF